MEHNSLLHRQHKMLSHLSLIPYKMLSLMERDNLTEFVIHDLCSEDCFNLVRAAYFVDNPDFDCLKGIAGFARDNTHKGERWNDPEHFSEHMKQCTFNTKVRSINKKSKSKENKELIHHVDDLAHDLGFKQYCINVWNMKHDNHGVFMYEKADGNDCAIDEYILNGVSLFSFCPVF